MATLWTIVGIIAAAILAAITPAQPRDASATWSWIDQYYADYTAMSAAPTGPAMEKWLEHYAPDAYFEDPTLGVSGQGHEQIRTPYVQAFTGPLGPVHWTVLRRATSGDWAVVEGWLDGTTTGKPFRTRFTTWLKIRDGRIVHQIDYLDYTPIRRLTSAPKAPNR
jgi:ketosteroid isomerase-like protein